MIEDNVNIVTSHWRRQERLGGHRRCAAFSPIGASRFSSTDLVCAPSHSLVHQSLHAAEAKTETNGDGFGIGWYGERPEPGIYREVRPAWSDENLRSLCDQVRSRPVLRPCARLHRHPDHPGQLPSLRPWPLSLHA